MVETTALELTTKTEVLLMGLTIRSFVDSLYALPPSVITQTEDKYWLLEIGQYVRWWEAVAGRTVLFYSLSDGEKRLEYILFHNEQRDIITLYDPGCSEHVRISDSTDVNQILGFGEMIGLVSQIVSSSFVYTE